MALQKRITSATLFPNGMLAVFDTSYKQVAELQGGYSIELHKRILMERTDDCEFLGFNILPEGFIKTAADYANHFRNRNMSWEEVKSLEK